MNPRDLPTLTFAGDANAPLPPSNVHPISFGAAQRHAQHRQRVLQRAEQMREASTLAQRARHEGEVNAAYQRGFNAGGRCDYRRGYVEGTRRGLWIGGMAGAIAMAALLWLSLQVGLHWGQRQPWMLQLLPEALRAAATGA